MIEEQTVTGEAGQLLQQVETTRGTMPNMFRVMANAPVVLQSYLAFSDALDRGKLDTRVREQIALVVCEVNSCGYCLAARTEAGLHAGLTEMEIEAAREARSGDPRVEAALRFARSLVQYRAEVTEWEFDTIRRAGYSDEEILEVIGTVMLSMYANYINIAVQTDPDGPAGRHRHGDDDAASE